MSKANFSGPYLKTERAEHHILQLKDIFSAHIDRNKKAMIPKYNRKPRKAAVIGSKLPRHTSTILGDALHNLRAALEHAYCILVEANGGTVNRYVRFPFTENGTRQDLEGSVNGHAKAGHGPSAQVIEFIFEEIQPFPGGKGEDLLKLHILDIADKHMILLPTQQRTFIEKLEFPGGGGIFGISFITDGDHDAVQIDGVPKDGTNNKASFEICFGDGQPFEGQHIIPMLEHLHARTIETLNGLERLI